MKMIRPGKMIREVLGSLLKKPVTTRYPHVKAQVPEGFRGEVKFYAQKCIGCKLCMKDCPAAAITIREAGVKKFEAEIDLGKCIFCAQCVDSCPRKALAVTGGFELAQLDKMKLKVISHAEPQTNTQERT